METPLTRTTVRDKIIMSKGGNSMKDILKSKVMILFIAMVLGVTYFDSLATEKLEDNHREDYQESIAINIK